MTGAISEGAIYTADSKSDMESTTEAALGLAQVCIIMTTV